MKKIDTRATDRSSSICGRVRVLGLLFVKRFQECFRIRWASSQMRMSSSFSSGVHVAVEVLELLRSPGAQDLPDRLVKAARPGGVMRQVPGLERVGHEVQGNRTDFPVPGPPRTTNTALWSISRAWAPGPGWS
jgi:hypothetical protein